MRVEAVIVPPMTIPATARRVRTERVSTGMPRITPIATPAPAPHAITTARNARGCARNRRAEVAVATVNITATAAITVAGAANTPFRATATTRQLHYGPSGRHDDSPPLRDSGERQRDERDADEAQQPECQSLRVGHR